MTLPTLTTTEPRVAAVYDNQRTWVSRAGGIDETGRPRDRFDHDGVLTARTGATAAVMLPDSTEPATLDAALGWLRAGGSGNALVWRAAPDLDADLLLLAHGARESFVPRWMTRPVARPLSDPPDGPATVGPVRAGDLPALLNATEIPYFSPWQATASTRLATRDLPDAVALVVTRIGGEIVGRGVLSLDHSPLGVTAGIYDVGIAPVWQRQGIGRQLVHALLATARERDAELVTLNATPAGERLYRAVGFEDAGEGQTWLLPTDVLRHPPTPAQVRFALGVGSGEPLTGLETLAWRLLPNRETPLALAARFGQVGSAKDLLALGTVPDVAALWELELEEEALATMRRHPRSLNIRYGAKQVTPLHLAVYWDHPSFLEALLAHGADPGIRDGEFDADARGWALALGRDESLAILDEHLTTR